VTGTHKARVLGAVRTEEQARQVSRPAQAQHFGTLSILDISQYGNRLQTGYRNIYVSHIWQALDALRPELEDEELHVAANLR